MAAAGDPAAELVERYDRQARAYRDHLAPVLQATGRRVVALLASRRTDRRVRAALDLGTGLGTLLPELGRAFPGALVLGCDRSRGMLRLRAPGAPVALADACRLPLGEASVDVVACAFVLGLLQEPRRAAAEVRRVLAPGGLLGVATWGGELASAAITAWNACLDGWLGPAPVEAPRAVASPGALAAALVGAGLVRVRVETAEVVVAEDPTSFLRWRMHLGRSARRLEGLAPARRAALSEEARARLTELPEEAFRAHAPVLLAVGERPGAGRDASLAPRPSCAR